MVYTKDFFSLKVRTFTVLLSESFLLFFEHILRICLYDKKIRMKVDFKERQKRTFVFVLKFIVKILKISMRDK